MLVHLTHFIIFIDKFNNRLAFNGLLTTELKLIKQVYLSERPSALKVIDNELWSCQWDGIAVYDDDLKLLRTMRGHDDPAVEGVAFLSDDRVVVAGGFDLYISTKSG